MPVKRKKNIYGDSTSGPLYRAVHSYVKKHGGDIVVIGGIQIQEWPQDNKGVFHISVKCLGRKPKFS